MSWCQGQKVMHDMLAYLCITLGSVKPRQGGFWMFSGLWEHKVQNNPQASGAKYLLPPTSCHLAHMKALLFLSAYFYRYIYIHLVITQSILNFTGLRRTFPAGQLHELSGKLPHHLTYPCITIFSNSLKVTPVSVIIVFIIWTLYVFSR